MDLFRFCSVLVSFRCKKRKAGAVSLLPCDRTADVISLSVAHAHPRALQNPQGAHGMERHVRRAAHHAQRMQKEKVHSQVTATLLRACSRRSLLLHSLRGGLHSCTRMAAAAVTTTAATIATTTTTTATTTTNNTATTTSSGTSHVPQPPSTTPHLSPANVARITLTLTRALALAHPAFSFYMPFQCGHERHEYEVCQYKECVPLPSAAR
jgi:hypothetical protein